MCARCGVKRERLVPTIVGGGEADPGEYPWMVALLLPGSCCGGAVINSRLVLIFKYSSLDLLDHTTDYWANLGHTE